MSLLRELDEYVVLDFEMPDMFAKRICAVGVCVFENGTVTDKYYSLIDPQCRFDSMISSITGLTAEAVAGAPTFPEAWEEIRPLLENKVIVAHGAANDLGALTRCLKAYNIEWHEKITFTCTFMIAQSVLPSDTKLGLDKLCEKYSVALPHHHNALSDAHACAELFLVYRKLFAPSAFFEMTFNTKTCHGEKSSDRRRQFRSLQFTEALRAIHSDEYAELQHCLLPDIPHEKLLGVPTKDIKKLSARLPYRVGEQSFFRSLPHNYFEEDLLHAFLINRIKKVEPCINALEKFLPYASDINVLISLTPQSFKQNRNGCLAWLNKKIQSDELNFEVFACDCFRRYFTGKYYSSEITERVISMKNADTKLVTDAQSRYLADMFTEHEEEITLILESGRLHRRTVAAAVKRIMSKKTVPNETKASLRRLLSEQKDM